MKIKIYAGKSESLFMSRSNYARNKSISDLEINDSKIPFKKSVRCLGYYVQSNLKHNEHINRILLKVHSGLHKLYPIRITTILRPVLTYAVTTCHNLPKYLTKKSKIFENKCLRMAINFRRSKANYKFISTERLHVMTKLPRLNVHLYDLATNA